MKTSRYMLIATVILLIGLSNAALARPKVRVDVSIGRPGFHIGYGTGDRWGSYRTPYRYRHREPRWGRRDYRPRQQTIIFGSGCWYDRGPDYYVAAPPRVIERVPVVIERQTVIVQPQQFNDSTLQLNLDLQYKKSELLKQLQMSDKELRRDAIRELGGFSFDDNVRYALEKVLLSDPFSELREEAANAFGKVKNANARAALEKARVEDPSADVRRAADEAIRNIEGN